MKKVFTAILLLLLLSCDESKEQNLHQIKFVENFLSTLQKANNKAFTSALGITDFNINNYLVVNEYCFGVDILHKIENEKDLDLYLTTQNNNYSQVSFHSMISNTQIITTMTKNRDVQISGVTCSNLLQLQSCGKITLTQKSKRAVVTVENSSLRFLVEQSNKKEFRIIPLQTDKTLNTEEFSCQSLTVKEYFSNIKP